MIFRKTRSDNDAQQPQAETTPPTAAAAEAEPAATADAATPVQPVEPGGPVTVITSDVVMEGNLVTSGELHLDGTIHGAVQAGRVIIQENGAISGQVLAQEVIIYGRAIGPICSVKVHLLPGAQVEGDVLSQGIVIEDGAFIDGQIRYSEDPLGEWQQMWYGDEAQAIEHEPQATAGLGDVDAQTSPLQQAGASVGSGAAATQTAAADAATAAAGTAAATGAAATGAVAAATTQHEADTGNDDTPAAPYLRPVDKPPAGKGDNAENAQKAPADSKGVKAENPDSNKAASHEPQEKAQEKPAAGSKED